MFSADYVFGRGSAQHWAAAAAVAVSGVSGDGVIAISESSPYSDRARRGLAVPSAGERRIPG